MSIDTSTSSNPGRTTSDLDARQGPDTSFSTIHAAGAVPRPGFETRRHRNLETPGFRRILVAVDGSEQSGFAVEAATQLGGQLGAEIVLLNVFWVECHASPELGFVDPELRSKRIEVGIALLARIEAEMPHTLRVEKAVREGNTAEEIIIAAALYDVDLIVMGTHGRRPMAQILMGSVANAVTCKALCPVMTVAHPFPIGCGTRSPGAECAVALKR